MTRINYKSDFDFLMRLIDCEGRDIGWPEFDWTARFWTWSKACSYTAGCTGGECVNCRREDEGIRVLMDGHNLGSGRLHVELTVQMPDGDMPDGDRRTVSPVALDIELVRDAGSACACPPDGVIAEIGIPWAFIHDTDAYNSILEKVNGEFGSILGPKPQTGTDSPVQRQYGQQTVTLTRGIIGVNSRAGMVYRNTGYIKIPTNPGRYPLDLKKEIYFDGDGGIPMDKVDMHPRFSLYQHFTAAAELNRTTMVFPVETGDYIAGMHLLGRHVCRLSIPTGEGFAYLWRNPASGLIEVYKGQLGAVVEQPVPSPEIPDFGSKGELFSYLSSIPANIEFMYYWGRGGRGRYVTRGWHRCKLSRIMGAFGTDRRGLIKVRTSFPKKRRSRWETLSLGPVSFIRL